MASSDRQRRHREQLRELILETAIRILAEHGDEGFTIRRLAKQIEYSPRTIYLYFSNRDDLIDAVVEKMFRNTVTDLRNSVSGSHSPEQIITDQVERHVRNGLSFPRLYRAIVSRIGAEEYRPVPAQEEVFQLSAAIFRGCLSSTELQKNYLFVTENFFASIRGFTMMLISSACRPDDPEARKRIALFTEVTLRGML